MSEGQPMSPGRPMSEGRLMSPGRPMSEGRPGDEPVSPPGSEELERLTYEELVALLEEIAQRMAMAEVGIEEATALYERAGIVHAAATRRLEAVASRLDRLAGGDPGER
ncbi:MAG: exodeoxyribonuclease VII small subunit [Acidimicrobiales bacterium]